MQSKPNANAKNSLFLCQNFPNILKELYDPQKVLNNVAYYESCDLEYWDETTYYLYWDPWFIIQAFNISYFTLII